jgi:prepilin-type N-terminal cleavage/methylation domain-containing protein
MESTDNAGQKRRGLGARRSAGFTLIEILVVIGIIGILVVVMVAVVMMYAGRGDEALARNFVSTVIPGAIEEWQQETGRRSNQFPPSPNMRVGGTYTEGNAELFNALVTEPDQGGRPAMVPRDMYEVGTYDGRQVFLDPWGNPYIYRNYTHRSAQQYDGRRLSDTYDIISMGPDGRYETEDDIYRGMD